jgi:hypothetical protein
MVTRDKALIKKIRVASLTSLIILILPLLTIHGIADSQAVQASPIQHVLLISVDGLHQSDLVWYANNHPSSLLAKMVQGGAEYSNAQTSDRSDSDPGGTALMTGGNPNTTGIYYDDSYNHAVLPAGTTSCHGQPTGGMVIYDSPDDLNVSRLDAGQNIPGINQNPALIMDMTATHRRY